MSSVGVGNNGGHGGKRRGKKKHAARANSRKGCMNGKGGPENASCTYKGVRQRTWGRWVSEIRQPNGGKRLWLGTFPSSLEAAMAYDSAARKLYGADARLNLPHEAPQPPPSRLTESENAVALAAAAEAKYNRLLLEIKVKQQLERQLKRQIMLMMQVQKQKQMQSYMEVQGEMSRNVIDKAFDESVVDVESAFKKLKFNLPEFDDSPMWVEAASTMDYQSQAICDPGIAASTFDDAIGIEIKHPLVV